jgi:hypothetical protein
MGAEEEESAELEHISLEESYREEEEAEPDEDEQVAKVSCPWSQKASQNNNEIGPQSPKGTYPVTCNCFAC